MNWRRSSLLRKSAALAREPRRRWRALRATEADYRAQPPIVCNSFPKSGTHLLIQILAAIPRIESMGAFLASTPSISFRERSAAAMCRRIARINPGELVAAHLHYDATSAAALRQRQAAHYFIYRDLRDVAVSEAHYLTRMNRWHRLHRVYRALPDDAARIAFAITGDVDCRLPVAYPDIAARFNRYKQWLNDPDVCAVRFEDLFGEAQHATIERIVAHYAKRIDYALDVPATVRAAVGAIDPSRSHTYRAGRASGWRDSATGFTSEHHALIERIAGDLLIELGYEPAAARRDQPPCES